MSTPGPEDGIFSLLAITVLDSPPSFYTPIHCHPGHSRSGLLVLRSTHSFGNWNQTLETTCSVGSTLVSDSRRAPALARPPPVESGSVLIQIKGQSRLPIQVSSLEHLTVLLL